MKAYKIFQLMIAFALIAIIMISIFFVTNSNSSSSPAQNLETPALNFQNQADQKSGAARRELASLRYADAIKQIIDGKRRIATTRVIEKAAEPETQSAVTIQTPFSDKSIPVIPTLPAS